MRWVNAGDVLLAGLLRAAGAVLGRLPLEAGFVLGGWLGGVVWELLPGLRSIAHKNLRLALGAEKAEHELRALAREHFRRLAANMASTFRLARMTPAAIEKRIEFVLDASVARARNGPRRPWIAAISHLGNWELCAQVRHFIPEYEIGTVFQPLRNRHINALVAALRARGGVRLFDRREAMLGRRVFFGSLRRWLC